MRKQVSLFTLLLLFLLSVPVASQETPEKPLYSPTGNEATLVGTISIKGKLPKIYRIDMTADMTCVKLNPKAEIDEVITNENWLMNAFIYVKSEALNGYRFEMPNSEAVLQQRNCMFEPHVLGLRVNQPLHIINADPTIHNIHPIPKFNLEWNQSYAPGAPPVVKTFPRPEMLVPFKDNHHPWERAYVGVMDHPFFAISDKFGKFEIRGLPAGTYKLIVWHETFGQQELEITLVPNELRSADFTFDADKSTPRSNSSSSVFTKP